MKRTTNWYARVILGIVFVLFIGIYAYMQSRVFLSGPTIDIISPKNGTTVYESFIEITGVAQNISHITLNDRSIFTDESGLFEEQLLLAEGYNIITIEAWDRFDRAILEEIEVVLK